MRVVFIVLSLIYFFSKNGNAQQSTLAGIVSIHNSQTETGKRQYVQYATVKDKLNRAQQVLTSINGEFDLVYIDSPSGISVKISVSKEGLGVVNSNNDLKAVLGQLDTMRVSMATPEQITEYSNKIYYAGYTNAEKKLNHEIKAAQNRIKTLETNREKNRKEIADLQEKIAYLNNKKGLLEQQIDELTNRYVQINLDDATPLYRSAFKLFQEGSPDEAIVVLSGTLEDMTTNFLAKKKQTSELEKEINESRKALSIELPKLIGIWQLKADMHKILLQNDSVKHCYNILFELDSNNTQTLRNYSIFLSDILDFESAIKVNKELLSLKSSKQDSAAYCNDIGNFYRDLGKVDSAWIYYKEAITLYDKLYMETNDEFFLYRKGSSFNNLGGVFSKMNDYDLSLYYYQKSISIYFELKHANDKILEEYAYTMMNAGSIFTFQDSISSSFKCLSSAIKIFEDLVDKDTINNDFKFQLANSYGLIAQNYRKADSLILSFEYYMIADSIFNQIYDKNILKYGYGYGRILMGFSIMLNEFESLYGQKIVIDDMFYSEYIMTKAISVFKRITKIYPRQFASEYSQILRNASDLFFENRKYEETLHYSQEGISLIEGLYLKTRQDSISLAIEYSKFSFLKYKINKEYHDAVSLMESAFQIWDSLSLINPKHLKDKESFYQQYSWLLILDEQFMKAEIYSKKDIKKSNHFFSYANLAHSLLLQHKFEDAKNIYNHLFELNNELFPTLKSDVLLFKKIKIIDDSAYSYFNQNILKLD